MPIRRNPETPNLSAATIAVVLHGWGAKAPEQSDHGFGGGFLALYDVDGIADTWRAHEAFLRATAARWGWGPGPDGLFYGERVIANGGIER
jgi:hypothetical protein